MSTTQLNLEMDETDNDRERPSTFLYCPECVDHVLASRQFEHEHTLYESRNEWLKENREDDKEDTDDDAQYPYGGSDPAEVGGMYDITLSYSVDYRFRVAGFDRHDAERRAKELVFDASPNEHMHVHTDERKVTTFYEDDIEAQKYDLLGYSVDALPDDVPRYEPEDGESE